MNALKTGLLAVSILIGTSSFAQQQPTPMEKANAQTEKLAKELNLTAEQKTKVSDLNIGIAKKNEAVINNTSLTPDQKKEHLQGNNNAQREQMKMILTEEQYKKYTTTIEPKEVHNETIKTKTE